MELYLKNYYLMEKHLNLGRESKMAIMNYFKNYDLIKWAFISENRDMFNLNEALILPSASSGFKIMEQCNEDVNRLKKMGVDYITPTSIYYPFALQYYKPKVKMLFACGNKDLLLDIKRVSIVGSRKPTAYGRKVAYDISRYLAKNGVCIVSGMALGIDAQAHKGALDAGGKTIAVLASGVNYIYPQTNEKLYHSILAGEGLVLSEQFVDEPPLRFHFPLRNRIISALADVVIIIEAGEKSGSLITAMHALEQGKTVFALPGSIFSPQSIGTNRLISEGAIPLINYEHVLENLGISAQNTKQNLPAAIKLSPHASKIYQLLKENTKLSMDEICSLTMIEYSEICAAVSELILEDLCEYLSLNEIMLL